MDHWDFKIIRAAVLHDIREFIPADHYQNTTPVQQGVKDGTMGKDLFYSTNPEMSARQYAASELLMWIGMYGATNATLSVLTDGKLQENSEFKATHVQLVEHEKQLMKDVLISLRRYILHLPDNEAKPLLSFLPDTPSKKTKVDPGEVKNRLSFLETTDKKLNEHQEDGRDFLRTAKKLWDENPNLNRTEIRKFQELAPYVRKYTAKTLSNWLRNIDPRPKERRAGRPRKNSPRP